MKRKSMMIVAALLAVLLLAYAAFAAVPQNEGYEVFKDLLRSKSMNDRESGHMEGSLEVIDNGETVIKIDGSFDGNRDTEEMSGNFTILTEVLEKELSVYGLGDMAYIYDVKSNDVYVANKSHDRHERGHRFEDDKEFTKQSEALMDFFIGDLKNEFVLIDKNDGTKALEFELTKEEMPTLFNLLTSVKSDRHNDHSNKEEWLEEHDMAGYPLFKEIHDANIELVELVDEVEFEYIKIALDLDQNNEVVGVSFVVEVSGIDENSNPHTITIKAEMNISNIDNVQINQIDLTGKNIIELPEFDKEDMKN